MNDARTELTATAADAAGQVAAVLDAHPFRSDARYPLPEVLARLAEQHAVLQDAVRAYPQPLAVGADGREDKLAGELSVLMVRLQHVLVIYHRLTEVPARMRDQAIRDLASTHAAARRVRNWVRAPR